MKVKYDDKYRTLDIHGDGFFTYVDVKKSEIAEKFEKFFNEYLKDAKFIKEKDVYRIKGTPFGVAKPVKTWYLILIDEWKMLSNTCYGNTRQQAIENSMCEIYKYIERGGIGI